MAGIMSYQAEKHLDPPKPDAARTARVVSYDADTHTAELHIDGEAVPRKKKAPCNQSLAFSAGQRVKLCKIAGTYVVEYPF